MRSLVKGLAVVVASVLLISVITFSTANAAVTPLPNPALQGSCGQNVAVVVDLSGSMQPGNIDYGSSSLYTLKGALRQYLNALKGSNTNIALFTFGTNAPNVGPAGTNTNGNVNTPLTSVQTQAGIDQLNNAITRWQGWGWTRWDLGLQQVADSAATGIHYDYVLFITDGYPTDSSGNTISTTSTPNIDAVITAANNVKADKTRIIVIYAPSGSAPISGALASIQAISGDKHNQANVMDNDYYDSDWSNVGHQLEAMATKCTSTTAITATRTIHYVDANNNTIADDVVQTVSYTKSTDSSTGTVTYEPENPSFEAVTSPVIAGYTPDKPSVGSVAVPVEADPPDLEVTVEYAPNVFNFNNSSWTVVPTTSAASGTIPYANGNSTKHDYWTATLTAKDQTDTAMTNLDISKISFTVAPMDGVTISSPVTNNHDGTYSVTITSTLASSPVATVKYNGQKVEPDRTISFQPGVVCVPSPTVTCDPDRAKQTRAEIGDNNALANGSATDSIIVYAFDANGNPTDATFTLISTDGTVNLSATNVTVTAGSNTRTITGTSRIIGLHDVSVSVGDTPLQESPLQLNYIANTVSATLSTLELDTTSTTVGGTVVATVTARDSDNHTLADVPVIVTVDKSATLGDAKEKSYTCTTTSPNGTCSVALTDTTAETVTVRATIGGEDITGSPATATFIKGGFSWNKSTFDVSPLVNLNDKSTWVTVSTGANYYTGTLTAKDDYENLLTDLDTDDFVFSAAPSTKVDITDVVNNHDGTYTVRYSSTLADATNSTRLAQVTYQDIFVGMAKPIPFKEGDAVVNPTCTDGLVGTNLSVDATTVTVGGTSHATALVTDEFCNAKPGVTVTFALDPGTSGGVAPTTKETDQYGKAYADVTDTVAETVTLHATITAGEIPSKKDITFVHGDLDPGRSTFDVYRTDPAASVVIADGAQSWTGKLVAMDKQGNLLSDLDTADMAFTVIPEGVTVSGVSNEGDGVYVVTYTSTKAGPYTAALTYDGKKIGEYQPISFVVGQVSGATSTVTVSPDREVAGALVTITVTARDEHDNPVMGLEETDVAVVGTSAGLPDLALSDFQKLAGGVYTYRATSRLIGDFEVRATVAGVLLPQTPHVEFYSGGVCVSKPTPVNPDNITRFVMMGNDALADGVDENSAMAYAYDCNGNPVEGATVTVEDMSAGDLAGYLHPVSQSVTTDPDGTVMVYWTSTKAGTFTAEGKIDGLRPEGGFMNAIRFGSGHGNAQKSDLVVTPESPIRVEGSYTATVTVRDETDNLVEGEAVSFRLAPGSSARLSDDYCTTGADGTCQVTVTSDLVTEAEIHATLRKVELGGNGIEVKASPQTVGFTAGPVCVTDCDPVNPENITRVEVITDGMEANGQAEDVARAYAYDRKGNPKQGVAVVSPTADTTLGVHTLGTTEADGTVLITYTSTVAGAHVAFVTIDSKLPVQAISSDGVRADGRITLNFSSGAASADDSYLTIDPETSQTVNSPFTVTAHVLDASKNPVSGASVDFPAVDNLTFDKTSCVSEADGTCQVEVTSRLMGTYTVRAELDGQELSNTVGAIFTAGEVCVRPLQECKPVNPANYSRVEVTLDGQLADGKGRDVATVWVYDYDGNPVKDAIVQSAPADGEDSLTVQPDVQRTGANGTTTIWYTSTVKGFHYADVTVDGKTLEESPITVSFGAGSGDPDHSSWVVGPEGPLTVGEGPESMYTATATVRDKTDNPVEGAVVTFGIVSPAHPVFTPENSCLTDEEGTCSVSVYSTTAGTYTLGAMITAGPIKNSDSNRYSASVAWRADVVCSQFEGCETVDPQLPDELRTRVEVTDDGRLADGTAKDVVTVWAFDKWGNPAAGAPVQSTTDDSALSIQTGISPIGSDGSSTIWYASTAAGGHDAVVFVGGQRPQDHVTLNFVAGGLDPATSTFEVYHTDPLALAVVADGAQSWTGKLVAKDAQENLLSDLDVADMEFTVMPEGVTISEVANEGEGVYLVTYTSTTSGSYTASLAYQDNKVGADQPIAFVAGSVSGKHSTVTVSPDRQVAGSPVTVRVVARDENDNPVAGLKSGDMFVVGRADGLPDLTVTGFQEIEDGVYTYQATSKLVGDFEVRATVTGTLLSEKPHAVFYAGGVCVGNPTPVNPDNITKFVMKDNDALADGADQDSVMAYAYDCFGNPVEGAAVTVEDKSTGELEGYLHPVSQATTTGTDGIAMVYWTSTKAGKFTAEGWISGLRPQGGVMNDIRFRNGYGDPSTSDLVVTPVSPIVVENSYTATVTVRDHTGNLVPDETVSFRLDPGSPAKLSADTCTTGPSGTCQVTVTSGLVTTVVIHATLPKDGQKVDLGGNGVEAAASPQTVSFVAGPVWVGPCAPEAGGNCTRVEVVIDGAEANGMATDVAKAYAYDRMGNAKSGVTVTSSTSDPALGIVSPVTTEADGTALIQYTSNVAGPHMAFVTIDSKVPAQAVSSDGTRADGRITVNFGSGTASAAESSLTIDPVRSQTVNSVFTVTAHVKDVNQNPVSGAVVEFPAVDNLTFDTTSCVSEADGTCEVTVTSRLMGMYTVSARLGAQALPNTVTATFTAGEVCVRPLQECEPVNPDNYSRVEVTLDGRQADGASKDIATVWAYDYDGNPVKDAVVQSAPADGETSLTVQSNVQRTGADGTTTVWYTSTVKGFHYADVTVDGRTLEESPIRMSFGAGNGDPDRSSWVVAPEGPLTVGEGVENAYTATATVRDAQDNPVEGAVVIFGVAPATNPVFAPENSCLTDEEGTCSVSVYSTTAGTYSLTAEIAAGPIKNFDNNRYSASVAWRADAVCSQFEGCETVDPELPDELRTRVEVTENDKAADGYAKDVVTVWAFDKWGNPAEGALVQSTTDDSALGVQTGISSIGKDGTSTIWYTSTVAGGHDAVVLVDGQRPQDHVTLNFVPGGLDPNTSTFEVYHTNPLALAVVADGAQSWTGKLVAKDAQENLLSNLNVADMEFTVVPEGVTVSRVTNEGDGVYTVTYTSTTSGPYTASLVYQDNKVGTDQPIAFVAGSVSDKHSTVTVSPDRQVAGSPVTITVLAKDEYDNPVLGLAATDVAVVGTAAGLPDLVITGFQPVADGVYTYQATSKLVGDFEVRATVTGTLLPEKPHAVFYAGGVCVGNPTPVDPDNVTRFAKVLTDQLANGVAQDSGMAYAYDCFGNPVEGASVVVTDKSTDSLAGFLRPPTQTVTTGADGTVMLYWTSTHPGTFTAEGTINGLRPEGGVMNWIRFTNGTADPAKSDLIVAPISPIQVENSYIATVTVRDATGNLVKDATVSFTLDPESPAKLSEESCTTGLDGVCRVMVTSDLVTTVAIHATLPKDGKAVDLGGNGNSAKSSPVTVGFVAGPVWVGPCAPEAAGNCTRVEVVIDGAEANGMATDVAKAYAYDRMGNAKSGVTVTSSTSDPALGIVSPVTTEADGTALVQYTSNVAGPHMAFVTIDSKVPAQAVSSDGTRADGRITVNFGSGTASAAESSLTIDPVRSQMVNSVFTVTAHVKDVNQNPVSGAVVEFPAVKDLTFDQASCVSGDDGTCRVTVTSRLVGMYTVSARLGAQALPNTVAARFVAGEVCVRPVQQCEPVNPDNYTRVEVTLDGRQADGLSRDVATVWAYDYDGNLVKDAVVASAPAAGETSLTVQPDIRATGADGTTTVWYTSTVKGFHDADVTIGGKTPTTSPIRMSFGAGNGAPNHSSWVVAPEGPLTVGEGVENAYTATATVRDAQDNPVEGAVVIFRIDPAVPVFLPVDSCFTNEQGVCSVTVYSTKSGTYSLMAEIAAGPIKNADNNQYAASVAWRADQVCSQAEGCETVDPQLPDVLRTRVEITVDKQLADGSARDIVTVWAFDKWGNPAEGALVQSSGDPALTVQTGIDAIGKNGSSTVWYTSMVAGSYVASVLVDGQTPVGSPSKLTFVVGPVCVAEAGCEPVGPGVDSSRQTRVEVSLNDQPAGGSDAIEVFAFDKTGNAVDGVEFEIIANDPKLSFGLTGRATIGNGGHTAWVTSGARNSVSATSPVGGSYAAAAFVDDVELIEHGSPMGLRFLGAPVITGPKDGGVTNEDPLVITGTGQVPGDKIVVTEGGDEVCEAVVSLDLTWTCKASLPDGKHTLVAVETNEDGVDSPPSEPVDVEIDTTAPAAPEVDPSNGSEVTGTTDPGTTVTVTDGGGKPVEGCVDIVPDESGHFSCTPVTPIPPETTVTVTATDPAGNTSEPKEVVISALGIDVAYPIRQLGQTQDVTGRNFNPSEQVCLTMGQTQIGCVAADENGMVAFTFPVPNGTSAGHQSVTLTGEKSGEVSGTFIVTVPGRPTITGPKDGSLTKDDLVTVTGIGEPGATVTVREGEVSLCEALVTDEGEWSCEAKLPDGEHTLVATATDESGNESDPSNPVTVTVDTTAPAAPVVDGSNGSSITGVVPGEVDPGTTVTVTDEKGKPVEGCESVPVDESGRFTCTPTTALPPTSEVTVTATDPAGNTSKPTQVVISALWMEIAHNSRQPGEEQVVIGYNFNPGEEVCLFLGEAKIGCGTADVDGTVTFSFIVPEGTPEGHQTVTLTGAVSGSVSSAFQVATIQVKTGGGAAETPLKGFVAGLVIAMAGVLVATQARKITSRN